MPFCPLTDDWFQKTQCAHSGVLLGLKKGEAVPFAATWTDLLLVKSVRRDRHHDITSTWNLKNNTGEIIYKTETDSQTQETNCVYKREKRKGARLGGWDQQVHSAVYKTNNKVLLYSTES